LDACGGCSKPLDRDPTRTRREHLVRQDRAHAGIRNWEKNKEKKKRKGRLVPSGWGRSVEKKTESKKNCLVARLRERTGKKGKGPAVANRLKKERNSMDTSR